jgi:fructose-1,6-bisphosphatase I/sedoheptulose-1,7-bisphosphatase
MDVAPSALHQRIGLVFGSRNEVELIERYTTRRRPWSCPSRCSASAACSAPA